MLVTNEWQKVEVAGRISIQSKGYATILYCNSLEKPMELADDNKTCQSINNYATNEKVPLDPEDKFIWLRTYETDKTVNVAIYDGLGEVGGGGTSGAVTVTSGNINVDNFPAIQEVTGTTKTTLEKYIEEGKAFQFSEKFESVGSNGESAFKFTTGSKPVKLSNVLLSTTFTRIETRVKTGCNSTQGAIISTYNLNKNVAEISESVIHKVTNLTGGIDVLAPTTIEVSSGSGGGIRMGGSGDTANGIILSPNTDYFFTGKNIGTTNGTGINLSFKINFIEV